MSDDIEKAADAVFLTIATDPHSTRIAIALCRHLADAFASRTLELAADRLAGLAMRPGPSGIDDAEALAGIAEVRPRLGAMSVAFVARQMFPGDEAAQAAAARRWRRKLTQIRT